MKKHTFHIPVLGIAYSIDTPLKVAQYGIDSVISLVDDILIEKIRKVYCEKYQLPYQEITSKIEDFRAKRITSYLNMMQEILEKKYEEIKNTTFENSQELKKYFDFLPDGSKIKKEFKERFENFINLDETKAWLKDNISFGSIDVNIMTKLDKDNYKKKEKLPVEYNDAHAALRGFANSKLASSLVLSAGMNPRLYAYIEQFDDFYPDKSGYIKKKVVLKVSDYRSALIQGKFLAKKGIWISEYRIESGLNCGGHAFATDGHLMGPILAEFRDNKTNLIDSIHEILIAALEKKNKTIPDKKLNLKITAQGGVGTSEEHEFLMQHYHLDSVGWGTPFLLVPEATIVDDDTLNKLINAKEDDLYLSNISPLGVPFNNLKGNTKDLEKAFWLKKNKPGSICTKHYVAVNNEFTDKYICPASRQYQTKKIKKLKSENLPIEEYKKEFEKIIEKSCICVGLGTPALVVNNLDTKVEGKGISVCPGPNMAYFNKKMSLSEIIDHIYGRTQNMERVDRPNVFIKELNIYIDYLKTKIEDTKNSLNTKQEKYFESFTKNLSEGINYYQELFSEAKDKFTDKKKSIFNELEISKEKIQDLYVKLKSKKA